MSSCKRADENNLLTSEQSHECASLESSREFLRLQQSSLGLYGKTSFQEPSVAGVGDGNELSRKTQRKLVNKTRTKTLAAEE